MEVLLKVFLKQTKMINNYCNRCLPFWGMRCPSPPPLLFSFDWSIFEVYKKRFEFSWEKIKELTSKLNNSIKQNKVSNISISLFLSLERIKAYCRVHIDYYRLTADSGVCISLYCRKTKSYFIFKAVVKNQIKGAKSPPPLYLCPKCFQGDVPYASLPL